MIKNDHFTVLVSIKGRLMSHFIYKEKIIPIDDTNSFTILWPFHRVISYGWEGKGRCG